MRVLFSLPLMLSRMHFLLVRNEEEVFGQLATLLAALLDALSSDSERVVLQVGRNAVCPGFSHSG